MNPLQKFVVRVCHINLNDAAVRFNVEQALREQRRQGKEEGLAQGRLETPTCLRCPLYLQEQISKALTAEELAAPNTDGDIAVQPKKYITPEWFKKRNPDLVKTNVLPRMRVTRDLRQLLNTDNNERDKKIS